MQQYFLLTIYLVKSTIIIINVSCVLELQLKTITASMYEMSENVYIHKFSFLFVMFCLFYLHQT